MSMKGWAEAHRYKGGIIRYLYDTVSALVAAQSGDDTEIAEIKEAIGKASGAGAGGILKDVKDIKDTLGDPTDPAEGTIEARLYALEHPTTTETTSGSGTE